MDLVALTQRVSCSPPRTPGSKAQLLAFHAVTAVRCGQETRQYPGQGEWLVSVRRIATTGVVALQAAYELPSQPLGGGPCLASLILVPPVVLVDAAGRAIAPEYPRDDCGQPLAAVLRALQTATWREVSAVKMQQLVTPQAQAANCDIQWKNENWLAGQMRWHASRGGPLFSQPPKAVHVCIYRVGGPDLLVGDFERGLTLSATNSQRLLAALAGRGPSGSCPPQRQFAVVTAVGASPPGEANVELGGCWRVQRPDLSVGTGSAEAAVIQALLLGR
jgi:hypothetical protein